MWARCNDHHDHDHHDHDHHDHRSSQVESGDKKKLIFDVKNVGTLTSLNSFLPSRRLRKKPQKKRNRRNLVWNVEAVTIRRKPVIFVKDSKCLSCTMTCGGMPRFSSFTNAGKAIKFITSMTVRVIHSIYEKCHNPPFTFTSSIH